MQRAGSDQIGGRFACSLSLTNRHTYIRVAALQRQFRRLPATWSAVACTQPVHSQREREREDGSERDRTYFHFSPVFAHGGNQRQFALVAQEADQVVASVEGNLLQLFCQRGGPGLEDSLPFRRRKHGKSDSCVQAAATATRPAAGDFFLRHLNLPHVCCLRPPALLPGMDEWISDEINSGSD